jgi:DNA-directed RNA polymerase I, II, and III subunit RPABC2
MSDNEQNSDYYSESDGSDSDIEIQKNTGIKILGNDKTSIGLGLPNIDDYNDSDSDVALEEDVEDAEDDQIGGRIGVAGIDWGSDTEDEGDDDEEEDDENNEDVEEEQPDTIKKTKGIKAKKPVKIEIHDDDNVDDDDVYDELYLQKFDNEITKNYINEFHPECLIHNYDEISKLTIVVRDSNNIIIDPLHKTIPYLTKYEKARILGQRAKQIETGARPFVQVPENIIDSYVIAELELKQKNIPFIIRRPIPGGACEYWNLKDLEVISF